MTEPEIKTDRLSALATRVAARDGLGDRRAWQAERMVGANIAGAVAGLVMAAFTGALGALVIWVATAIHIGGYHVFLLGIMAIGIIILVFAVFLVGLAIRSAFAGPASTFLYDEAIVAVSGRTTDVVRWSQIDRLVVATSRGGKPTRYIVTALNGREIRINPKPLGQGDDVADRVVSAVRNLGRPIVDGGPDADDGF